MDQTELTRIERDQKLITDIGGPSKVAKLLMFPKAGGQQRVQNWMARGIPNAIKVEWPDIFMKDWAVVQQPHAEPATETVADAQPKEVAPWDGKTERRKLDAPPDRRVSPASVAQAAWKRGQQTAKQQGA